MLTQERQKLAIFSVAFSIFIASCAGAAVDSDGAEVSDSGEPRQTASADTDYRIVTLLPKDAIPSIDNPRFYSVSEADEEYDPKELVIGVDFDGEARAYSVNMLSSREIVNDTVAGRPIAITW